MRRARLAISIVLSLSWGCADSCSCGERGAPPERATGTAPERTATPAHTSDTPRASQQSPAPQVSPSAPAWTPAPKSALRRKLEAAQKAIENGRVYPQLVSEKVLGSPLGTRLGKLQAQGEISSVVQSSTEVKFVSASRIYAAGEKTVNVKITDTGMLPAVRKSVASKLTMLGNEISGSGRGMLMRGQPAIIEHFDKEKVSRGTALVGDRYLLQILVRGADDPYEALQVLEQLDFSSLGVESASR
jgi:hypothetical protein